MNWFSLRYLMFVIHHSVFITQNKKPVLSNGQFALGDMGVLVFNQPGAVYSACCLYL